MFWRARFKAFQGLLISAPDRDTACKVAEQFKAVRSLELLSLTKARSQKPPSLGPPGIRLFQYIDQNGVYWRENTPVLHETWTDQDLVNLLFHKEP